MEFEQIKEFIQNWEYTPHAIGAIIIAIMLLFSHWRDKARASKLAKLKRKIERLEFKV